ncbi:MAG TPA: helix-turn-helix domain-containing protein [Methylomirabilota bacterium]|nr:helix-turn-helix domain-containing protein [Methylomirabilota bacterium]
MQVRILPPLPLLLTTTERSAYSYLLGMYLGDGYVCRMPRTYRLEIYLHRNDQRGIRQASVAIQTLLPRHRIGLRRHGGATVVTCYFKGWPMLFPQHGPGRKNARPIALVDWQSAIVADFPGDFLRGCIDSDGCRHRRIVYGRNYPAYSFTNHSEDILGLFTSVCDAIGLRWRRANRVTISIARRADVARLDALFAGALRSPQAERPAAAADASVTADQVPEAWV